ncbi:MAG: hypothetical protein Q7S31_03045 [bacterium]|nr:hypothetical protein [bacterium]
MASCDNCLAGYGIHCEDQRFFNLWFQEAHIIVNGAIALRTSEPVDSCPVLTDTIPQKTVASKILENAAKARRTIDLSAIGPGNW